MFADWGDSMNIYSNIKHKLLIRKLKKLCFHSSYFAGCEIYRLLNYNTLPQIARNIKTGKVRFCSKLLFGRLTVSSEEQFIYILNKYIVFIRFHFFIPATELVAIIEETLKNEYNSILYSHLDYNNGSNSKLFQLEFKKMFVAGILANYKRFYIDKNNKDLLQLSNLDISKEEDVVEAFNKLKKVINYRHSNLYYCFVDSNKISETEETFYVAKWKTFVNGYINDLKEKRNLLET